MKNKAQLKIQEMMFMLLGVFLFFILAGLFMLSIVSSNLQKSANQIAEEKTYASVLSIANSPEFRCASKPKCIDSDKLIGIMNNANYRNFWSYSSLEIIKQSGFGKQESQMIKCTSLNYPDCDYFAIYNKNKEERTVSSFIALCRKELENGNIYDKCEIAKLIAGTEVRK